MHPNKFKNIPINIDWGFKIVNKVHKQGFQSKLSHMHNMLIRLFNKTIQ